MNARLFLTAIVLPALAVCVMTLFEVGIDPIDWRRRTAKLGWDLCVLGFGAIGGVFASFQKSPDSVGLYEAGAFIVVAGLAALIILLRKGTAEPTKPFPGWKAFLALALGGAAMIVPVLLTTVW